MTTISPWLSVKDAKEAVNYYKAAFGAVESDLLVDETGDVIVALNGERVGEVADLNKLLSRDHARTTLLMTVARGAWEYTLTFPLN